MTREELFCKIWKLPNFLYRYSVKDKLNDFYAVLGYYCSSPPTNSSISTDYMHMLDEMIEIYQKPELTDADKNKLSKNMHRLQKKLDYHFNNERKKEEQKKFIEDLTNEQFEEICEQVDMYIFSKDLYKQGYK